MTGQNDWETKQKALLDDIDRFARGEARFDVEVPPAMVSTGFLPHDVAPPPAVAAAASGPAAIPPAAVTAVTEKAAPPPTPAPAAPAAPAAGGLLARLKQQAAEKQAAESSQAELDAARKREIDAALQDTYGYIRDLAEQLNVLKPAYPGGYFLVEPIHFQELAWQEGRADYRRVEGVTEERLLERVTLRYQLAAPTPLVVDKENPAMETLRRFLNDYGLAFELQEIRNDRGRTERGRFTIKREIRAGLQFVADYQAGDIRLRTLNVQRLGSADYRIPAAVLTHQTVEEIALLVLGESNQFVRRFKRVA